MLRLPIYFFILILSLDRGHCTSFCYSCNPCGTTWNPSMATTALTSGPNDYCRKTVTGTLVVRDSVAVCNPVNVANNGVYCCQSDYCNSAIKYSYKFMNIQLLLMILLWIIYYRLH